MPISLSLLRAKVDALRFQAGEASLILKGQIPPRFIKAKFLAAAQADLAAARAEVGRLASELELARTDLMAARAETGRLAKQLALVRAPELESK